MTNLDDTQPNRIVGYPAPDHGIPAPPRFLLWGVIGIFLLGIIGAIGGVYAFREVLPPRYQSRVMQILPFMEAFMTGGAAIPTAEAVDPNAIETLLGLNPSMPQINTETTAEPTPEISTTAEATQEAVAAAVAVVPTQTPLPTQTILPTATLAPTATPLVEVQPTLQEAAVAQADTQTVSTRPTAHNLTGFVWDRQKWNNCGPANITVALSYYAWQEDQDYAAQFLRPNQEDKNVSPEELAAFVNNETLVRSLTRIGGDLDLLRDLLANGFPVIIEVGGNLFEGYDWLGHYRTLVGYNDSSSNFYIYDTFLGAGVGGEGITENYATLDAQWQAFNRTFIVVYEPAREQLVMDILGDLAHPGGAAVHALEVAQAEATADPTNPFVWFNMGTALNQLARYTEAATAFDLARQYELPWRMLWYQFGPFEAYFNVGRYDDVLSLVQNNLTNNGEYVEETYFWQGQVFQAQGRTQDAINAYRNALSMNRYYTEAQQALDALT
jgi:tetratricopeptide (TPR) repeat protein